MAVYIPRNDMNEIKQKVYFYLEVHRFEAAEKLLKTNLVALGPLANLHNLLGVTYHKQSRFPEAIEQFQLALKSNPAFIEAGLNLTITLCDLSHYEQASAAFKSISRYNDERKKIPQLLVGRLADQHAQNGHSYLAANLFEEAIEEYEKALTLYQPMLDVQLQLVRAYLKSNYLEKARKELEGILRIAPDMCEALILLGLVYYRMERADMAKKSWLSAYDKHPHDIFARSYAQLGETLSI